MGPVGLPEMIAIFLIALVLFGPKKLPELGRTLGKALSEFRRAKNELKSTFESHLHELERETRFNEPTSYNPPDYSHSRYSYPYEDYNHYGADYSSSQDSSHESSGSGAPQLSAPASADENSETHPDSSGVEVSAVADTVPRSNGVKPAQPVSAPEQEHPA